MRKVHQQQKIIYSSKYTKHLEAIKGRCINIRIPCPNIYDKEIIIKKFIKKEKINCKIEDYLYLEGNIDFIKNKILTNYRDPYDIFLEKIKNIMKTKLSKNIENIKELAYNFKNSVLDINILSKRILNFYLSENIHDSKKIKIVKKITDFNYLMVKCYKEYYI